MMDDSFCDALLTPVGDFKAFHAHLYFDAASIEHATWLSEEADRLFPLKLGRIHQKLVGPHPCWSRQLAFDAKTYPALIEWLAGERQGLDIFVHPLSGDDLADHSTYARWLGQPKTLKLSIFNA